MTHFLFVFCLGCLFSCRHQGADIPENIIPPDKMGKVLTDMHLADAIANQNFPSQGGNDTIAWKTKSFSTLIFKKYGIDSSSFQKSFRFYVQRPELMDSIYSKMITDLTRKQSGMQREGQRSTVPVPVPASRKISVGNAAPLNKAH